MGPAVITLLSVTEGKSAVALNEKPALKGPIIVTESNCASPIPLVVSVIALPVEPRPFNTIEKLVISTVEVAMLKRSLSAVNGTIVVPENELPAMVILSAVIVIGPPVLSSAKIPGPTLMRTGLAKLATVLATATA